MIKLEKDGRIVTMNTNKGFIKLIFNIIVAVALIGFFASTIKPYVDSRIQSPNIRAQVDRGLDVAAYVWQVWLQPPTFYLWNNIVLGIIWPTIESKTGGLLNNSVPASDVHVEGVGTGN